MKQTRPKKKKVIFGVYTQYRPNGKAFYVGKGTKGRAYSFSPRNPYYANIVKKHGESKLRVKWAPCTSEEAAFEKEFFTIRYYKGIGVRLANMSKGGEGNSGYRWTKKQRSTMRGILRALWRDPVYFKIFIDSRQNRPPISKETSKLLKKSIRAAWKHPKKRARWLRGMRKTSKTKKFKQTCGKATAKTWKDPKIRRKRIRSLRKTMSTPAYSKTQSEAMYKRWRKKGQKKKQGKTVRKLWKTKSYREHTILTQAFGWTKRRLTKQGKALTLRNLLKAYYWQIYGRLDRKKQEQKKFASKKKFTCKLVPGLAYLPQEDKIVKVTA